MCFGLFLTLHATSCTSPLSVTGSIYCFHCTACGIFCSCLRNAALFHAFITAALLKNIRSDHCFGFSYLKTFVLERSWTNKTTGQSNQKKTQECRIQTRVSPPPALVSPTSAISCGPWESLLLSKSGDWIYKIWVGGNWAHCLCPEDETPCVYDLIAFTTIDSMKCCWDLSPALYSRLVSMESR